MDQGKEFNQKVTQEKSAGKGIASTSSPELQSISGSDVDSGTGPVTVDEAITTKSEDKPADTVDPESLVWDENKFSKFEFIAPGGYGYVCRAFSEQLGKDVALKMIKVKNSITRLEYARAEVNLMARLNHKNLMSLIGSIECDDEIILIMNLVPMGDLTNLIIREKDLPTADKIERARVVTKQISMGVHYLHNEIKVVHADIKPSNVLVLCDNHFLLCDFGSAIKFEGDGKSLQPENFRGGTLYFMPVEIHDKEDFSSNIDIWSVGCTAFVTIFNSHPFFSNDDKSTCRLDDAKLRMRAVEQGQLGPLFEQLPETVKMFFKQVFSPKLTRLFSSEIVNHEWIKQGSSADYPIVALPQESSKLCEKRALPNESGNGTVSAEKKKPKMTENNDFETKSKPCVCESTEVPSNLS